MMLLMTVVAGIMTFFGAQSTGDGVDGGSRIVATVETPNVAKCVTVEGRYAYVGYRGGMLVFDVSSPESPVLLDDVDCGGSYINEIRVIGDRAYLAAGLGGVMVLDLTDGAHPKRIGGFSELGEVMGIDVYGSYMYASGNGSGLSTLRVHENGKLELLGQRRLSVGGQCVQRVGDSIFVSDRRAGLAIYEPLENHHARETSITKTADEAFGFQIAGNIAYICDQDTGFTMIDVRDTRWPKYLQTIELPGFAYRVDVEGTRAYIASTKAGIHVIDVYDPAQPRLVERVGGFEYAFDIDVVGRYGYVADSNSGFKVVEFARD